MLFFIFSLVAAHTSIKKRDFVDSEDVSVDKMLQTLEISQLSSSIQNHYSSLLKSNTILLEIAQHLSQYQFGERENNILLNLSQLNSVWISSLVKYLNPLDDLHKPIINWLGLLVLNRYQFKLVNANYLQRAVIRRKVNTITIRSLLLLPKPIDINRDPLYMTEEDLMEYIENLKLNCRENDPCQQDIVEMIRIYIVHHL